MAHVWMTVLGLMVLLTGAVLVLPIANRVRFPFTVLLAIVGMGVGFLAEGLGIFGHVAQLAGDHHGSGSAFKDALIALVSLDVTSEAILFIFLPALVFESALSIDVRRLLEDIGPILFLAALGLLVSTAVIGIVLNQASGMSLIACLLLGAICSATDPVAVVAIFKEVGAPKRLAILVEGESLFNDATAIVVFTLLLAMLTGEGGISLLGGVGSFLKVFIGGVVVGFVMARLYCMVIARLNDFPLAAITLTITLAYLSFIVAEHYLHVSGVMAAVTAALVVGSTGRTAIKPAIFHSMHEIWEQLGFWANAVIFVLVGIAVPHLLAKADAQLFMMVGVLIVTATVIRSLIVYGSVPLLSRLGVAQKVSQSFQTVMVWGGLRGAVSLALALAVVENDHVPEDARTFIAVLVTGFVLFTLFTQATTIRTVMSKLGLDKLSHAEEALRNRSVGFAADRIRGSVNEFGQARGLTEDEINAAFDEETGFEDKAFEATVTDEEWITAGLKAMLSQERRAYLDGFGSGAISSTALRELLMRVDDIADATKSGGIEGYRKASEQAVEFDRGFRVGRWVQRRFGIDTVLARAIALRFEVLDAMAAALTARSAEDSNEMRALVGDKGAEQAALELADRIKQVERRLNNIKLLYPDYVEQVEARNLRLVALRLEQADYDRLAAQSLIGASVHQSLTDELEEKRRALAQLPELDIHLDAERLLRQVPLFAKLSDSEIAAVGKLMKPRLMLPDEMIFKQGDVGREMYFISLGAVEVILPDRSVELGSGSYFGEIALFEDQERNASVKTLSFCEVLALSRDDLDRLLDGNPELRDELRSEISRRLAENH